jgi:signal transduction histidine kinase
MHQNQLAVFLAFTLFASLLGEVMWQRASGERQAADLLLFAAVLVSALLSLLVSQRVTRRILRNVNRLSLLANQPESPAFDYEEFDRVARVNHQAYSALKTALRQKAAILSHFPGGYAVVDPRGVLADFNERGAALFGHQREELLGRRLSPEQSAIPLLVMQAGTAVEGEYVASSPCGNKVLYHYTFPLALDSGEDGAMSWFLDLTEQKTMQLYLQYQDRLTTVEEMTSTICHDVRNPLTTIKLTAQLARMAPDRAEQVKAWARIDEAVAEIMNYFETVLAFCRSGEEAPTVCQVRELCENVATMLRGKCDYHHIRIVIDLEDQNLAIRVRPGEFQQVLANLVNNAFEAMAGRAEGGEITLRADRLNEQARLRVSDTGPGIPEEELGRIWDLFHTTKPKRGGLGLTIARKLVEQAGGRLEAFSAVGQGTTFIILLPPAPEAKTFRPDARDKKRGSPPSAEKLSVS